MNKRKVYSEDNIHEEENIALSTSATFQILFLI